MPLQVVEHCQDQIATLRQSACFAMSRGGRELFHTNFIAFVLDIDTDAAAVPPSVAGVQNSLLKVLFGVDAPPTRVITWREKSSLDLVLIAAPNETSGQPALGSCFLELVNKRNKHKHWLTPHGLLGVVIEAKLKSLPTTEQLERYDTKLKSGLNLAFQEPIEVASLNWSSVLLVESSQAKAESPPSQPAAGSSSRTSRRSRENATIWAYASSYSSGTQDLQESDSGKQDDPEKRRKCFAGTSCRLDKVLLAPPLATYRRSEIEGTAWQVIDFKDIANAFRHPRGDDQSLLSQLFTDYANSTTSLLRVLEATQAMITQFRQDPLNTLADVNAAVGHSSLKNLRIYDLIGKHAYDHIANHLVADAKLSKQVNCGSLTFKCRAYGFFAHGEPGMGIEYVAMLDKQDRSVSAGVQVQGVSYRHYVSASHSHHMKEISLHDLASHSHDWMTMPPIMGNPDRGVFGEEAFIYFQARAKSFTYFQLQGHVEKSMKTLARLLPKDSFRHAANNILQDRSTGSQRKPSHGRQT